MSASIRQDQPRKSVIVIGGGVAGLAAGGVLARRGMKVTLLEANDKLGGCCATTTVDGYTFNDGAVYLTLPGLLDRVFDRLGLDRAAALPLRKITANGRITLPDGTTVTIGDGVQISVAKPGACAAERDAASEEELRRLLQKWTPALRFVTDELLTRPFSLARLLIQGWRHLPKFRGNAAAELDRAVRSEPVRAALSSLLLYAGLPPDRMPAISMLGLAALFTDGFFLPEGGMGRIPQAMSRALLDAGGEIHLASPVRRIRIDGGKVAGVEVDGRGFIEADAVLSSLTGMLTFSCLLRGEDGAMQRKVQRTPLSHQAFSLQLGLSQATDASHHFDACVPMMKEQHQVFRPGTDGAVRWPMYFVPTVTMPELSSRGGSIVEMYPPIRQDLPASAWTQELEQQTAQHALEALSWLGSTPVAARRILSPRYYQDQLHLYRGAVYGISPAADPRALFPHKTSIPGLYLAGQTTYPGYGVCPAAMSGILAAESLLATSGIRAAVRNESADVA